MGENERGKTYEHAISRLDQYVKRAADGTLELTISGEHVDIDPIVFADLERSLEETNRKIRAGEISADQVVKPEIY